MSAPAGIRPTRRATTTGVSEAPSPATADAHAALDLAPWLARHARRVHRRRRAYQHAKRAFDVAVVGALAPLWAPVYGVCALAVKLDSPDGPVHFAQSRTGVEGRRVRVRKLRTMVPDADERKASLAHLNEREWPDFKITDDPRITRVGRVLRATSLDELPQLLNVVRGEMTLVGPRPWSQGIEQHEPWHLERYAVPAGVTGLWQIAARDADSFTERIRLDLAYKQRRSLLLDLEILLRTVPAVLGRKGA